MRVLRVPTINGDGSSAAGTTFPFYPDVDAAGEPYRDENGQPCVEIVLQIVPDERRRQIAEVHTEHVQISKGPMQQRVNREAVEKDIVAEAIVSWRGFVGADSKPLVCVEGTKRAVDALLRAQIISRITFAQPAEVTAASFRESAAVPGVVSGTPERSNVLPAGVAG